MLSTCGHRALRLIAAMVAGAWLGVSADAEDRRTGPPRALAPYMPSLRLST